MTVKRREAWIDYIKVFACILVVLGHFFQSMVTGNEIVNYSLIAVGTIAGAIAVAFCWSLLQKRIQASFGRK